MKPRKPIRRKSKHRAKIDRQRALLMLEYFGPRPWKCYMHGVWTIALGIDVGPCYGRVDGHEVLKRSRAGSTDENLLDMAGIRLLCSRHNTWIEDHPPEATRLGLADHAWDRPEGKITHETD
jgi:hypothetical protein